MNVYSLRVIPRLKIRFCEWMGIATSMAVEQMSERLTRIDLKMDRLETHLRRLTRRQMVFEAWPGEAAEPVKKKSVKSNKKRKRVGPGRPDSGNVTSLEAAASRKKAQVQRKPVVLPLVILVQPDEPSREVVEEYFQNRAEIQPVESLEEMAQLEEGREVLAIFFERTLLGEPQVRRTLELLKEELPTTRLIGLSSYLTLALAKSVPGTENLAHFLNRPLSQEILHDAFGDKPGEAISGRD